MSQTLLSRLACAIILTLAAGAAQAAPVIHGPADAAEAVLQAEHRFAQHVAEAGSAVGFRDAMDATDGLVFAGGAPARGADAIYKAQGGDRKENAKLSWEPTEIFVAKGADMAVSWGQWTYAPFDASKKPITGRFVTVWRKNDKGEWKGLIDIGTPD